VYQADQFKTRLVRTRARVKARTRPLQTSVFLFSIPSAKTISTAVTIFASGCWKISGDERFISPIRPVQALHVLINPGATVFRDPFRIPTPN
jgi:hypothetical protein